MDLDDWLITVSLLCLVYALLTWLRGAVLPARAGQSVKTNRVQRPLKMRSRRSARSNVVNAGSAHQEAGSQGSNVRPNVQGSPAIVAPPAAPPAEPEVLTLTPQEVTQLAAAVAARAGGATVEEAILAGFGAKKGGSAAYQRAKRLFDVAVGPPA